MDSYIFFDLFFKLSGQSQAHEAGPKEQNEDVQQSCRCRFVDNRTAPATKATGFATKAAADL